MKLVIKITIGILIAAVFWIVGCSTELPIIPFVKTDYFSTESSKSLVDGHTVTNTDNELTMFEIPNYYPEKEQCLDFWFTSSNGKHVLTVTNFKMTVTNNKGNEIEPLNTYLFWDEGSEDQIFNIDNYEIEKTDTQGKNKYVFFRTVVNLSGERDFSINIKTNYFLDGVQRHIDKTLHLKKRRKLTWNNFRVH